MAGTDPRHRRRRQRAAAVAGFMLLTLMMAWFFESQATTTVIFVRYAEPQRGAGDDPGLSQAGWLRAQELARVLGDVDVVAGVDAIFTTPARRARETAQPLAEALDLPIQTREADEVKKLIRRILRKYKGKIVLVVTEPDPLPLLIRELHGSKKLRPLTDDDHDDIFIVSIPWFGKVKTLHLHYGARPAPPLDDTVGPLPVLPGA